MQCTTFVRFSEATPDTLFSRANSVLSCGPIGV